MSGSYASFKSTVTQRLLEDLVTVTKERDALRKSHAELVAALKLARPYVEDMPTLEADTYLRKIDAALKTAEAL